MAPQKETIMALKVDLDCPRCYRKVKKLLCQFHQIHDQVFNEKQNTVMIKVVCCSPEKIRDKLCSKGGKSIKSIEILQPRAPPPPPPPEKPADPAPSPPPPAEKPKEEAPPPPEPAPAPAPEEAPVPPPAEPEKMKKNGSKNGSRKIQPPPEQEEAPPTEPEPEPAPEPKPDPPPAEPAPAPVPQAEPVHQADPVQCYPVCQVNPVNVCCPECYAGHRRGPCNHGYGYGYGVPAAPPSAAGWGYYDCPPPGGYGGGYSGGYGYGSSGYNNNSNSYKPGYCVSRCGDYISDENPTACAIM